MNKHIYLPWEPVKNDDGSIKQDPFYFRGDLSDPKSYVVVYYNLISFIKICKYNIVRHNNGSFAYSSSSNEFSSLEEAKEQADLNLRKLNHIVIDDWNKIYKYKLLI